MLVKELLQERDQRRVKEMYHGTSSKFLPSILKHGLLPHVPHKSFGSQHGLEWASLGGVYLTSDVNVAVDASTDAVDNHGGHGILINVSYVEGSGGLDEDLIFVEYINIGIKHLFSKGKLVSLEKFLSDTLSTAINHFAKFANPTRKTQQLIASFFKTLHLHITQRIIPHIDQDIIMRDETLRRIITDILESAKASSSSSIVRLTRPIKYQGKTRITQILDLDTGEVLYKGK